MASSGVNPALRGWGRWGVLLAWVGWGTVAVLIAWFYGRAVLNYMHFDAAHYADFWAAKWWLVMHLGGGSVVLLTGPFQFSGWLRRRYVAVHRWIGRLYLAGVVVASVAAAYMGLYVATKAFGIALLYMDLAWVVTTGMAYVAVLRRQFAAHREWMVRSYVVTFAFVAFRLMEELNMHAVLAREGPAGDAQAATLAWIAWTVPLLVAEVVLQWRRSVG